MTTRDTLHFLTCGHVDDGKSTLIGRLLHDIGAIPEDQTAGAIVDGVIDYSRLTDGLEDERAQGITIDAAYRFFRHGGRHYRIADTPGHVQYVRNMAVAAANSDAVLVLVDASHGVREQTVHHSRIAAFFGIRNFIVAVNKMDLVGYERERFDAIAENYRKALGDISGVALQFIPVSALNGVNLTSRGAHAKWYKGPSVLEALAVLQVPPSPRHGACLPVQLVVRTQDTRRGYMGSLSGGNIRVGGNLRVGDTGESITISEIFHSGRAVSEARPGEAIMVLTEQDVDLSRGNVLYAPEAHMQPTDAFVARLLWLDPGFNHRDAVQCVLKVHNREELVEVQVQQSGHAFAEAKIFAATPLVIDAYHRNRATGLFMLIESETEKVIGIGTVLSPQDQEWGFSI